MTEKFWREPYRAPSFSSAVTMSLVIIFACFSFVRGLGLLFDTNVHSVSPQTLHTLHSQLWGWGLTAGSLYLILSICFGKKFFVWAGHVFLFAVYFGLMLDLGKIVLEDGGDGYRNLLVPLGGVIWHVIFVRLVRPFGKADRGSV